MGQLGRARRAPLRACLPAGRTHHCRRRRRRRRRRRERVDGLHEARAVGVDVVVALDDPPARQALIGPPRGGGGSGVGWGVYYG